MSLQSRNETIKTLQKAAAHWPGLDDHRQAACCSHQAASNVCNTLRVIPEQKRLGTRDGVLVLALSSKRDPMATVHCEPGKPVGIVIQSLSSKFCRMSMIPMCFSIKRKVSVPGVCLDHTVPNSAHQHIPSHLNQKAFHVHIPGTM